MNRRPMYHMKSSLGKLIGWKLFVREKHTGEMIKIVNRKYRVKLPIQEWVRQVVKDNTTWYHQFDVYVQPLNK